MHLLTYKIVLVIFELNGIINNMKIIFWETIKTESKENRNGRTYITKCVFVNPKKTIFEKKKYSHNNVYDTFWYTFQIIYFLLKYTGLNILKWMKNYYITVSAKQTLNKFWHEMDICIENTINCSVIGIL